MRVYRIFPPLGEILSGDAQTGDPSAPPRIGGKGQGLWWASRHSCGILAPSPTWVLDAGWYCETLVHAGIHKSWPFAEGQPKVNPDEVEQLLADVAGRLEALPLDAPLAAALASSTSGQPATITWCVRSSANLEDLPGLSGAGIFQSFIDVKSEEIYGAVKDVWRSVWSLPAYAYLTAHGRSLLDVEMAVLIHPYVAGRQLTLFTVDPSAPSSSHSEAISGSANDTLCLEWHPSGRESNTKSSGDDGPRFVPRSEVPRLPAGDLTARVATAALALEAAKGVPVDTEWVIRPDGSAVLLQVRAITARAPGSFVGSPPDGGRWELDGTHNPWPLSPAQQALVELVSDPGAREQASRLRQVVLSGYLYVASPATAETTTSKLDAAGLDALYAQQIAPAMEACVAPLEGVSPPALADALVAYRAIFELYAERLAPSLRAARAAFMAFLRAHDWQAYASRLIAGAPNETTARNEALFRGRTSEVIARWGAFAPVWDVAVATFDEQPSRLHSLSHALPEASSPETRRELAEARSFALEQTLAESLSQAEERATFAAAVALGRVGFRIGEADDLFFARAQRLVRRALLGCGSAPAIFFSLPLGHPDAAWTKRQAKMEKQRQLVPPLYFEHGRPHFPATPQSGVARGLAGGGRARGRVGTGTGDVLVLRALEPQNSQLLLGAAALVTDHGGLLSHEATLAREYGIPAVLATGNATTMFSEGDEVVVDGEAGAVYRLT